MLLQKPSHQTDISENMYESITQQPWDAPSRNHGVGLTTLSATVMCVGVKGILSVEGFSDKHNTFEPRCNLLVSKGAEKAMRAYDRRLKGAGKRPCVRHKSAPRFGSTQQVGVARRLANTASDLPMQEMLQVPRKRGVFDAEICQIKKLTAENAKLREQALVLEQANTKLREQALALKQTMSPMHHVGAAEVLLHRTTISKCPLSELKLCRSDLHACLDPLAMIRKRYQDVMRRWHPDKVSADASAADRKFAETKAASAAAAWSALRDGPFSQVCDECNC